jgi:hypothetical protein
MEPGLMALAARPAADPADARERAAGRGDLPEILPVLRSWKMLLDVSGGGEVPVEAEKASLARIAGLKRGPLLAQNFKPCSQLGGGQAGRG